LNRMFFRTQFLKNLLLLCLNVVVFGHKGEKIFLSIAMYLRIYDRKHKLKILL